MLEKRLRELIAFAKETDLQEVTLENDGTKIAFRRAPGNVVHRPSTGTNGSAASAAEEPPVSVEPLFIRSTMVGTFYRAETQNRPPLVVEGTLVVSGQPVGSIEAMKIMKDVVSPMPCRIVKALVANGHAVEYGQPLFEVEADANV